MEPSTPAPVLTLLPDESHKGKASWRGPWATSLPPRSHGLLLTPILLTQAIVRFPVSSSARRKRLYLSLDIGRLLANEGIDSNKLMPRHPDLSNPQTIEQGNDPLFPTYLPLKVSPGSTEGWWSGGWGAGPQLSSQTRMGTPWQLQVLVKQGDCIIGVP